MCHTGTTTDLILYLASLGSRNQLHPPHPLNDLLDTLCQHSQRVLTKGPSRGDPAPILTCTLCGQQQFA